MSEEPPAEKATHGAAAEVTAEAIAAAERQRCIDRILAFATLRDQAAVNLDRAASGSGPEKPSEGAAERARMQAEVARDIASYLAEESKA